MENGLFVLSLKASIIGRIFEISDLIGIIGKLIYMTYPIKYFVLMRFYEEIMKQVKQTRWSVISEA